jgi:hypothetical protein
VGPDGTTQKNDETTIRKHGSGPVQGGELFRPDGLVLPEVLSGQEYFEVGYRIMVAKKCSSVWWRQWREYGENSYGEEFQKDTESQIEAQLQLELGMPPESPKPNLNEGLGKGASIVSIEGIRHGFDLWRRKVEFDRWDTNDRKKACELLRPMVEFYDLLLADEARDSVNPKWRSAK